MDIGGIIFRASKTLTKPITDYDTIDWKRIRYHHHPSLDHKMTYVLVLCSVLIINLNPIRGSSYCEDVPCGFVESTKLKLEIAKPELDVISDLTANVVKNEIIVTEEFNPSVKQALHDLHELLLYTEDLNNEDLIVDEVPEDLFLRLNMEERSCTQLEERYDKLLMETEMIVNNILQLSNKEKETEDLLQVIKKHSSNLMQALVTTQQNSEKLMNNKMANSEFNRTIQDMIFQLNKTLSSPLLIGNSDLLNLKDQLEKSYDINVQLVGIFQEIEKLRGSLQKLREIGDNMEAMGKDIQAILNSFNAKNETRVPSNNNNNRFAKTNKNNKKRKEGLSVAEIIKSKKENKNG
ncbi:factor of DNA methylation 1-like isoform X1 [Centruroides sculpturatus]|uniref:factor of DNA methylation 1-like isoform X1 n=1 Tax=Centruroides sculpturatus TaxID=218467 RepID=UPI000C6D2846|nr:factor of DNA methylation 1-like isoform X1 [Centruroides sculpturatus]XP_023236483.1 factor of DNA methylation 1-like isoform X1 [Centruroides sculpturatus]XP_023236486.1 factor of DNA methylation 1-like isoform X1 [Centruroides sculpturatus]XP_023236487.1 factor of DNA methylation 1-like isoform X1 [Centruroides sculpturatus]